MRQVVDTMEKWGHHDFPLADMELIGFNSGVTELCACFVQLQRLCITDCAALVHWPEAEFQGLVSLRSLNIMSCEHLVGYAAEPSTTSESSSQLLPRLESLKIYGCTSMVEVFRLPASLRKMTIRDCAKLRSIFSRRMPQQGQPSASSIVQGSPPVHSEVLPCLEEIDIRGCSGLTGALDLPASLKRLSVRWVEVSGISLGRVPVAGGPLHWALRDPVILTGWPATVPVSQSAQGLRLSWYEEAPCLPAATLR